MRRIGRYEVRRLLCRGTTPLFEAVDAALGKPVVIRALAPALAMDRERRSRFLDAAAAAAQLDSPYIVRVLDLGDEQGVPFVVMEMPEGESLRSVMDEPAPRLVDFRLKVLTQMCDAVAHAHHHGVTQLGLRPPGIFATDEGEVSVAPFGTIPIQGSGGTLTSLVIEEVAYLAPELVEGRIPDRRADVFTLGVIGYELMARRRPFLGTSIPALLQEIVEDRPDPAALEHTQHSPDLEKAILKALARDPGDRYCEAGAMSVDLRDLAQAPAASLGLTGRYLKHLRLEVGRCLHERRWDQALEACARLREIAPGDPLPAQVEAAVVEGRREEAAAGRASIRLGLAPALGGLQDGTKDLARP